MGCGCNVETIVLYRIYIKEVTCSSHGDLIKLMQLIKGLFGSKDLIRFWNLWIPETIGLKLLNPNLIGRF